MNSTTNDTPPRTAASATPAPLHPLPPPITEPCTITPPQHPPFATASADFSNEYEHAALTSPDRVVGTHNASCGEDLLPPVAVARPMRGRWARLRANSAAQLGHLTSGAGDLHCPAARCT